MPSCAVSIASEAPSVVRLGRALGAVLVFRRSSFRILVDSFEPPSYAVHLPPSAPAERAFSWR